MLKKLPMQCPEELAELESFDLESAKEVIEAAATVAEAEEVEAAANEEVEQEIHSDLDSLYLAPDLKAKLIEGGILTVQELAVCDAERLQEIPGINEEDLTIIEAAKKSFFGSKDAEVEQGQQ